MIPQLDCMMKSKGPEGCTDCLGPSVCCMKEHCSCLFNNVSDPLFNFAILVVCSNSTEAHCLSLLFHMTLEKCVSKSAIVSMIMLDCDIH